VRLLLDTHIWLWSLLAPDRLGRRVARELESPRNEVWLSPISAWEVLVLAWKGRISLREKPGAWVRNVLKELHFKEAPINHEVAIRSEVLDLPHGDPADWFLVATALVYELTLVTADDRLVRARGLSVLPNR